MLLAAPILIGLGTAVLCFILRGFALHRWVSMAGAVALLVTGVLIFAEVLAEGPVSAQMGGWAAPYGITLASDLLSASMVVITGLAGVAAVWYSLAEIDGERERHGFHALTHAMLGGVSGAFLTGDLFNLYVWYEVMLISSFGLLVVGGGRASIDGAVKYVTLNLVGTIAFLTGVGLLYGTTGTVNMADLAGKVAGRETETAVLGSAALLLFAFSAKAAVFPVFFWLPAAYHTPAVATSALFSALLTKVGVYSILRVFTLIFDASAPGLQGVLLTAAVITVALGALGAVSQTEIRRIYSFHIVSQIGMMMIGLALYTPLGIAGAIFYFFHHIPAKMNMFLLGGLIARDCGSERLSRIGGMWAAAPWLGVVFLIPMLSLIGVPPFSGFWAKLLILRASIDAEAFVVVGVALVASLLTFFYLGRIFVEAFWKPRPEGAEPAPGGGVPGAMLGPILVLSAVTLVVSFGAPVFFGLAEQAAAELLDPSAYVRAVMGDPS